MKSRSWFSVWVCPWSGQELSYIDHWLACILSDLRAGRVSRARSMMSRLVRVAGRLED